MDFSPEQYWNAKDPMLVTLSGIEIDVSPEQLKNAQPPIIVTGQLPSVDGMEIAPDAGETPVTVAASPLTENDHV